MILEHPVYGPLHPIPGGASNGVKELADGRDIAVVALLHGYAAVMICPRDAGWRDGYWQYQDVGLALAAAERWEGEGEPVGWYKHPGSGRRRPDGDPAQEVYWP